MLLYTIKDFRHLDLKLIHHYCWDRFLHNCYVLKNTEFYGVMSTFYYTVLNLYFITLTFRKIMVNLLVLCFRLHYSGQVFVGSTFLIISAEKCFIFFLQKLKRKYQKFFHFFFLIFHLIFLRN